MFTERLKNKQMRPDGVERGEGVDLKHSERGEPRARSSHVKCGAVARDRTPVPPLARIAPQVREHERTIEKLSERCKSAEHAREGG